MEVGRGSSGFNNDFHERRKKTKKKFGSLPLGVFLSFNDRGVHPKCPNASNSYHKCGRHCFDKIPPVEGFAGIVEGDPDRGKKFEKEGVNPNCPNASNPYHKCAEYCFEKLSDQPAMKLKEEKKAGLTPDRLVKSECKFASNPYHVCAEHCLDSVPTRDQPEQIMRLKSSREVKKVPRKKERTTGSPPPCNHKSIPYHECTEICLQSAPNSNFAEREKSNGHIVQSDERSARSNRSASVPFHIVPDYCLEDSLEKEHPKRAMKLKEEKGAGLTTDRLVKSKCKFASNPYHVCAEHCLDSVPTRDQPEQIMRLKSSREEKKAPRKKERTSGSPPSCNHKSIPYHQCAEICLQSVPNSNFAEREKSNGDIVQSDERSARFNRSASVPFHTVPEYCLEDSLEKEHLKRDDSKEVSTKADKNGVRDSLEHASSSFHKINEYFFEDTPEKDHYNEAKKLKEESDIFATAKSRVNLVGKSNNSHGNTTFCAQIVSDRKIRGENPGGVSVTDDNTSEHHKPKHLSSPYQKTTEYCFEDTTEKELPEGVVKLEEDIEMVRSISEREHHEEAMTKEKEENKVFSSPPRMNSECKNASNPYHKCAEICNENALEKSDQPGKTFTRSKVKETVDFPAEGAVNPDCQFASNRYHVCAEYCFQNVTEREKRRQGEPVLLKGLKELKKLVSKKKITRGQPQCNFASNPYHKCTEYCLNGNMPDEAMKINERKKVDNYSTRRDVDPSHKHASKKNEEAEVTFKEKKRDSLKDGMKRSSAESRHVDVSNPISDKFDLKDITKDLHSAKSAKIKNLKESADVQLIDSSDISHEWAKYCSQKGADDVGMPVREKKGNVEGGVFLKDYASETLKVQTSGRLPISLLFFLGFLFSAVYWIQMIHSFIMSPEKVEGG